MPGVGRGVPLGGVIMKKGRERARPGGIWEKVFQAARTASAKPPGQPMQGEWEEQLGARPCRASGREQDLHSCSE